MVYTASVEQVSTAISVMSAIDRDFFLRKIR